MKYILLTIGVLFCFGCNDDIEKPNRRKMNIGKYRDIDYATHNEDGSMSMIKEDTTFIRYKDGTIDTVTFQK